ncbi:MAG TPA: PAS domain-containing protein, partial [Phenylobacterium sp.]
MDQRAGENMLEFIAAHTSDVFVRVDGSGIVTYASPSIRTYGYDPADIVGTNGLQLIHPEDRQHFAANLGALLAGEISDTADRQHRFVTRDGDILWIEGNPTLAFGPDGKPDGFVN